MPRFRIPDLRARVWTWVRERPYFWWDSLVASDVGLIRFWSAVRVTASVALTFAVIDALTHLTELPRAMLVMGIIESLFGSMAVRDPSPAKQRTTLLLTPLPTAAALTLGTALAHWRVVGDGSFLIVIFAATYARRFGARATAFGMLAYISYFLGLFLHLPFSQLPYQMLAIVVGAASAYVVRFVLFRDRPDRTLKHVLSSFYSRIDKIAGQVDAAMAAGAWDDRRRRRLRHLLIQLNETALAAEGQIEALDPLKPASRRSELGMRLFDLEVAAGTLADAAVRTLPPPPERAVLHRTLGLLRDALGGAPGAWPGAGDDAVGAGGPVARAIGNVADALHAMPSAEPQAEGTTGGQPAGPEGPEPEPAESRLLPTTRAAIQVTLGCALAILPGEFLSSQRWYWAVITVFVIFTGTQSRGDVLAKGVQRGVGTLVGVAAGILVATAVSGDYALSVGLIFACVFLGFYLVQAAYGLMIFWITILIALLYGLMGLFTPALLLLRVEETAIGAVVGVLVAQFVLPTSSRQTFIAAGRAFLQALGDLVGRAVQPGSDDLTGLAREVDRRFHQLRSAGAPLTGGLSGVLVSTEARRRVRIFLACDHYARILASARKGDFTTGALGVECRRLAAGIDTRIGRILTALTEHRTHPTVPSRNLAMSKDVAEVGVDADGRSAVVPALAGIEAATRLLARDLGIADHENTGSS